MHFELTMQAQLEMLFKALLSNDRNFILGCMVVRGQLNS